VQPLTPLEVCDVLQDLSKHGGAVVEIRGEWDGAGLMGNCPLPKTPRTLLSGIVLELPQNLSEFDQKANWTVEVDAWNREVAKAAELVRLAKGTRPALEATVVGRLDVRQFVEDGLGYGHLNQYPARLVIMSVKDISVVQR
jgi:hypothetical protein